MKENLIGADDLLSTFAQQRQVLLKHTADVLCSDAQPVRQETEVQHAKLSAILVSSLEELKVAEEELVERTEALADLRDELEQRVRGARALFELAPTCLIVTDLYGTILEVNREASALFRRDGSQLERQPLARFIAVDERRGFRDGLTRIAATSGVSDWRFQLVRPTDAPLSVSAAVRVVKTPGAVTGSQLFWSIRVVGPGDPSHVA
jgi:PAS domain-containing protein